MLVAKRLRRLATIFTVSLLSMILFTQCFATRPAMTTGVVDRVVLMGTLVDFQQPGGINVPAGISRSQFKNMSAEINELMSSYTDTLHQAVAANLRTQLGCEVLYGKELQSLPQYDQLRDTYERADGMTSDNEHFPEAFVSAGDFNFVITEYNGGDPTGFNGMKTLNQDELKQTVANMCSDLNIKYLAYAHFILSGYKMDLITPNTATIIYSVSLFNQDGDLVAAGSSMQAGKIKEGQPEVFQALLEQYLATAEAIQLKTTKPRK